MRSLWPRMTPGMPGRVAPITLPCGVERCAKYHSDGDERPRCGSFASKGAPVTVRLPLTTQLFEPRPSGGGAGRARISRSKRSEEHTSELQSLMRISYAVFCLKKKKNKQNKPH